MFMDFIKLDSGIAFFIRCHIDIPDGANQESQQTVQQRLHFPEEQPQHSRGDAEAVDI